MTYYPGMKENYRNSNCQNKNDLTSEKSIRENIYNGKGLLKPKSNEVLTDYFVINIIVLLEVVKELMGVYFKRELNK